MSTGRWLFTPTMNRVLGRLSEKRVIVHPAYCTAGVGSKVGEWHLEAMCSEFSVGPLNDAWGLLV